MGVLTQNFRSTVSALWQLAQLGEPRFAADGSTSLNFDDVDLLLTPSPNEQELIVSTDLGPLSDAMASDADFLQKVLGLSFAFLATHNVLVSLDGDRLIVSANYLFRIQNIQMLSELLSDVVSAAQTLDGQLGQAMAPSARMSAAKDAGQDAMMIFQP